MGEAYLDWQKKTSGIKLNDVIEEFKYVYKGQEVKAGDFVNYIEGSASEGVTEQQVTPAIEPPFNAIALSSGVGGTDTEHNEQVKIARVYKEVVKTDNLFSKNWAKVSNTEYKADDGTIFIVPNNDGDLPLSNAFDGNEDTYTEGGDAGTQDLEHSFQVTLPQQIKITKMKIKWYTDTYTQYFSSFKIEGSNDGSGWNNLYQTSTMPSSGMNEYTLDNANYYKHYRIYATFTVDSSLKLYEWQTSEYTEVIQ